MRPLVKTLQWSRYFETKGLVKCRKLTMRLETLCARTPQTSPIMSVTPLLLNATLPLHLTALRSSSVESSKSFFTLRQFVRVSVNTTLKLV